MLVVRAQDRAAPILRGDAVVLREGDHLAACALHGGAPQGEHVGPGQAHGGVAVLGLLS